MRRSNYLNMGTNTGHDEDSIDEAPTVQDPDTMQNDQSSLEEQIAPIDWLPPPSTGQLIQGVFIEIQDGNAIVSIGQKTEAIIPAENMQSLQQSEIKSLVSGSVLTCIIVRGATNQSPAILSVDKAQQEMEWQSLQETLEDRSTIEGIAISTNRGGYLVKLQYLQGFVPISQMSLGLQTERAGLTQQEDRIGQTLKLKVLEVDKTRNRIVLSERAAINEDRTSQKVKLISELTEGQLVTGHVSGLTDFGAFVDLGGADGLIHISELSWGSVGKASEILELNQEVSVSVLRVDPDKNRIALSLRRTQPEPWDTVGQRYESGQIVEGTVTKLAEFGAFARVEFGIEGLIHISEISLRTIRHPREVLSEGDVVSLKVLTVDSAKRRLSLSLKQATEEGF